MLILRILQPLVDLVVRLASALEFRIPRLVEPAAVLQWMRIRVSLEAPRQLVRQRMSVFLEVPRQLVRQRMSVFRRFHGPRKICSPWLQLLRRSLPFLSILAKGLLLRVTSSSPDKRLRRTGAQSAFLTFPLRLLRVVSLPLELSRVRHLETFRSVVRVRISRLLALYCIAI